jgi:hypothetical protein
MKVIEYSIETSLHLLQVRVGDAVSLLDLVNFSAKVQKDPQYRPTLNTLFTVETDTLLEKLGPGSLSTFFRRFEESGGPTAWAIVLSDESHKCVFSAALENFVPKRLRLRVFDDELPALQWLKSN